MSSEGKIKLGSVSLWIWKYLKPEAKVFIPSLIALFVTAGLSLIFPLLLKDLIGDPAEAWKNGVDPTSVQEGLARNLKWMIGALFLQSFIAFWRVIGFIKSSEGALNRLRRELFAHLMKLPVSYYEELRAGVLSSRVAGDLGVVRSTITNTVPQAIRQTVILIGGLSAVFYFSPRLALVMMSCIPVVVISVALFGRTVRNRSREAQQALADAGTVIEESVQSIRDVKAFGNESFELGRYSDALERFFKVAMRGAIARAGFLSFIILVMFGTIACVAWYGAQLLVTGGIENDDFVAFLLFSVFVAASLGSFPEIVSQFQAMTGATERIREIMADQVERGGTEVLGKLDGRVEFRKVRFRYPSRPDRLILDDISFEVEPGNRVALVGQSGAGKSTMFSLLLGFHRPESGEILLDGKSSSDLSLVSMRDRMAMVPQEVLLFGGTIRENIEYGRLGASVEDIEAAAKEANAHDFICELPEGYGTVVGPRGVKISGGQRQRVAIARAILANPGILLLDEATSALDAESERLVNDALERLMKGRTSLVIAHRLSTVRNADRIVVVSCGRVVESGTHDELMEVSGTYRLLVETQLS